METPKSEGQVPKPPRKNPLEKLKGLASQLFGMLVGLLSRVKLPGKGAAAGIKIKVPAGLGEKLSKIKKLIPAPVLKMAAGLFEKAEKLLEGLLNKLPQPFRGMVLPHKRKVLAGLLALIVIWGIMHVMPKKQEGPAVSLEQAMKEKADKKEDSSIPIKGFKVGRFNFEDSLNALGTIKGAMEFKLSFEVPGTISSINYREGERYEEGALLISLKQDDVLLRLKRAQAEFNKAKTQADITEQKVKENEKLYAMGAVPKSTLEQAKLEFESSKYEAEANRLEVKANEAMLEKSNLYAPSAGMIGELNIEEGETVSQNTLLGTHIMTEYVYAEFGVVERDVNKIALGQKARIFVDAFPDKTFEGVIENIAPVVAGNSRTATVKVRIENPDRLLLPGMFSRIRILLYSKKNTLVIPTDSVQGKEGEQFVYVVHSSKGPLIKKDAPKEGEAPAEGAAPGAAPGKEGAAGMPAGLPGLGAGPQPNDQQGTENKGAAANPTEEGQEAPQEQVVNPESEEQPAKESKKKDKKGKKGSKDKGAQPEAPVKKKEEELTVKKRPITVGYTRPDYTQIDAGLSEGEVVAISGLEKLEDNKKVRLLETQEAEL